MSRLDESTNIAYILDSLIALRNIYDSGSCNDCKTSVERVYPYKPKPGQQVRYNCPFYAGEEQP